MNRLALLSALAALAAASLPARAADSDPAHDILAAVRDNRIADLRRAVKEAPAAAGATFQGGWTPLAYAVYLNRFEAAAELLSAGVDPNAAASDTLVTPLHRAADRGFEDLVRLLLENKADAQAAAATGFTALHFAARTNAAECVRLLLAAGADVDAKDANGRTPLHIAAKYDAQAAAAALLAAGARADARDKYDISPAQLASLPELVEALGGVPATDAEPEGGEAAPAPPEAPADPVVPDLEDPGEEDEEPLPVVSWEGNPFHDDSLDVPARVRRFHADPGTRVLPDGTTYWGGWDGDRFEGFGVLLAPSERDRYEGQFHRGRKSGPGTYYYANGDVLTAEFENDAPNGPGEFVFGSGGSVKGVWKHGLFWQGQGTFVGANGSRHAGTWAEGELVGSRSID